MSGVVDELKEKIDIVELISQYVQLKKRGSNYFGLCPFHSEKTPSFSVNPKGQFFHCFGCGESGDAITFFMKIENLDFNDAIRELAEKYNVTLHFSKKEGNDPIVEIHKIAQDYFYEKLTKNESAMNYLKLRKITSKIIESFLIGFAPQSGELYSILRKNFKDDDILRSGIFIKTTNGMYNRFSNRIIFPIKNEKGLTVAFGGRIFNKSKDVAKYINSPETAVFSKQKILYGLFEAKDEIRNKNRVIITEGYLDCIRLHASGIKNAVATLGTALSAYHLNTIKRYAENIYFNYDADEAGFRAMARSAKTVLSSTLFSYVISLDAKEDPDSFILKYGKDAYLKKIEEAQDYFDYLMEYLKKKYDITKPQNKLKAINEIKPVLMGIRDTTMRLSYISKAAKVFEVSQDAFARQENTKEFFLKNINKEEALLSLLLKDIEFVSWIEEFEKFADNLHSPYKELYKKIVEFYLTGEKFSLRSFEETIDSEELKKLVYRLFSIEYTDIDSRHEARKIFLGLLSKFETEQIKLRLKELEKSLGTNPSNKMLKEYNELFKKLKESLS